MQQRVDDIQAEASVKDKTAQRWIEILVSKARDIQKERLVNAPTRDPRLNGRMSSEARKELVAQIKLDIQQEILEWLYTQPNESYNRIPADSGKESSICYFILH